MASTQQSAMCGPRWLEHVGCLLNNRQQKGCVVEHLSTSKHVHRLSHGRLSQEAFGAAARLAAQHGWSLYYLRPKVHMMGHLVCHVCNLLLLILACPIGLSLPFSKARSGASIGESNVSICAISSLFCSQLLPQALYRFCYS